MTAIHQNALSSHHSIDDAGHHSENRSGGDGHAKQAASNSAGELFSSTVNISYQAVLHLKAYQEQKQPPKNAASPANATESAIRANKTLSPSNNDKINNPNVDGHDGISNGSQTVISSRVNPGAFPQFINSMLTEVQDNLVQLNEPGYRYLTNLLSNHGDSIANPQGLQEVMRKEQFFLTRRKPFMNSSEFHSYSQVLNQFANIIERQQNYS